MTTLTENKSTPNNLFFIKDGKKTHLAEILNEKLDLDVSMGESTIKDNLHALRCKFGEMVVRTMADENPKELQDFAMGFYCILDNLDAIVKDYEKI